VAVAGKAQVFGAALGLATAALGVALLWGFTVDDALIPARVAHHWATGHGHRFNAEGSVVDAVTPLGFPALLLPGAGEETWDAFAFARVSGALLWGLGAAALGVGVARQGERRRRFVPLLILALSAPVGAWASAGLETGWVLAATTLGVLLLARRPVVAALCLGLAAAWRPELLPWALTVSVGTVFAETRAPSRALAQVFLTVLPTMACVGVRLAVFGAAVPLGVEAKPSDLQHGLSYVLTGLTWPSLFHGAALPLTGACWLLLGFRSYARVTWRTRVLAVSVLVHAAALVLAGGDWMALHRLLVPILPALTLAASELAEHSSRARLGLRCVPALAVNLAVLAVVGPPARSVLEHRRTLSRVAEAELAAPSVVATVDVGWVGAARSGAVFDLAGVTDKRVAALPGGHTSKRIPDALLDAANVDACLLLLAPGAPLEPRIEDLRFARLVETRIAGWAAAREFTVRASWPLGGTEQRYVLLVRVSVH
jgi:hypothetical protein